MVIVGLFVVCSLAITTVAVPASEEETELHGYIKELDIQLVRYRALAGNLPRYKEELKRIKARLKQRESFLSADQAVMQGLAGVRGVWSAPEKRSGYKRLTYAMEGSERASMDAAQKVLRGIFHRTYTASVDQDGWKMTVALYQHIPPEPPKAKEPLHIVFERYNASRLEQIKRKEEELRRLKAQVKAVVEELTPYEKQRLEHLMSTIGSLRHPNVMPLIALFFAEEKPLLEEGQLEVQESGIVITGVLNDPKVALEPLIPEGFELLKEELRSDRLTLVLRTANPP